MQPQQREQKSSSRENSLLIPPPFLSTFVDFVDLEWTSKSLDQNKNYFVLILWELFCFMLFQIRLRSNLCYIIFIIMRLLIINPLLHWKMLISSTRGQKNIFIVNSECETKIQDWFQSFKYIMKKLNIWVTKKSVSINTKVIVSVIN